MKLVDSLKLILFFLGGFKKLFLVDNFLGVEVKVLYL